MPSAKSARDGQEVQAALEARGAASDANDFQSEHKIFPDDAVFEYPQSGERVRGRRNIQASRTAQPNAKRFTVRRSVGVGNLRVSEFVLAYDGRPFIFCQRCGGSLWRGLLGNSVLLRRFRAKTITRATCIPIASLQQSLARRSCL